ncbi:hypothetical protein M9458_022990, partial [Cirrhinus mrigala]
SHQVCSSPVWRWAPSPAVSWASRWSRWRIIITTGSSLRTGVVRAQTASLLVSMPWSAPLRV